MVKDEESLCGQTKADIKKKRHRRKKKLLRKKYK